MTIASPPPAAPAGAATGPASVPAKSAASTLRVLAAMARKEARELAPWLAVICLAYSAGLVFAFYQINAERYSNLSSFLTSTFFAVSILVPPGAAMLLGFVQMETRPDRYAFLVHRPATRSLIFWSKIATAIPLFLLALGVPLLLAMLWVRNPSNLAVPFTWDMALAPLADLLMAIPFYLAGMLAARRTETHWMGSRLLPLAAPGVIGTIALISSNFAIAVLILAIGAVLYLVPARAAFATGGQERAQGPLARGLLGLILSVGIFIAGAALFALIANFASARVYTSSYVHYELLKDGTPVRVYQVDQKRTFETLDGSPLATPEGFLPMGAISVSDHYLTLQELGRSGFHEAGYYFSLAMTFNDNISWYRHAGGDYLVGFDRKEHRLVGTIGASGFTPGIAVPPDRFSSPVIVVRQPQLMNESTVVIAFGSSAYLFGDNKELVPLFTAPDHARICAVGHVITEYATTEEGQRAVDYYRCIATEKTIYLLNRDHQVVVQFPLEFPADCYLTVGRLNDAKQFAVRVSPYRNPPLPGQQDKVYFVTQQGELAKTLTLPSTSYNSTQSRQILIDVVAPALMPPVLLGTVGVIRQIADPEGMSRDYGEFVRAVSLGVAVSAALAIGMFFLARHWRLKKSATLLWTLLLFLLGPVGIFLLLSVRGIPVRIRCHTCGKQRPVGQKACPDCGAAFAPPAKNGTEIFA